ncbi:MAG: metal-dependent hydrolase [Proteobacteria bacterium]|nr:metal-dependent hydrolase [Pseudomonadota bacterium]
MLSRILIVATAIVLWASPIWAAEVEVLWLGHATVRFTSVEGKVIVVDPFLKKNPKTPAEYKDLKALGKVDLILVTHGHSDHTRDLVELASLTGAKIVGPYGYALNMISLGLIPGEKFVGMNKGGTVSPLGQGIKVHMVPAEHGSAVDYTMPGFTLEPNSLRLREGGVPVGYVVEFENGFKIYHSGDTAVFGDMALIREFYNPDLAMVCIGGHFTMDPVGAAYALKKLLKPKQVIPIHYGTYPVINRTPAELIEALGDSSIEVLEMKPGQTLAF